MNPEEILVRRRRMMGTGRLYQGDRNRTRSLGRCISQNLKTQHVVRRTNKVKWCPDIKQEDWNRFNRFNDKEVICDLGENSVRGLTRTKDSLH